MAYFAGQRYEEAAHAVDRALSERPSYVPALRLKTALCGLSGRLDQAQSWKGRLLAATPDASVAQMDNFYRPYFNRNPRALEALLEGMRRAGMPEA
jgi:tetratricopeptide (TPR) repeat protein